MQRAVGVDGDAERPRLAAGDVGIDIDRGDIRGDKAKLLMLIASLVPLNMPRNTSAWRRSNSSRPR